MELLEKIRSILFKKKEEEEIEIVTVDKKIKQNKEMTQKQILENTAVAFNSVIVMEKLKNAVAQEPISGSIKRRHISYDNDAVDYIYNEMYKKMPSGFYWEEIIEIIAEDMVNHDFASTPSMKYYKKDKNAKERQHSSYDNETVEKLKDISLLEHTFNITQECVATFGHSQDPRVFLILCSCILHDFGKCDALTKKLEVEQRMKSTPHEYLSSVYVEKLYQIMKIHAGDSINGGEHRAAHKYQLENLLLIRDAVEMHHCPIEEKGSIAWEVQQIDSQCRKRELLRIKSSTTSLLEKHILKNKRK